MRVAGWCVDTLLYFSIFVRLHTTYVSRKNVKVVNIVKIRKHYLAHGFTFDLLAAFPFDFVAFFTFGKTYSTLRWFRLPRLLRIVDLAKLFHRMRIQTTGNSERIR